MAIQSPGMKETLQVRRLSSYRQFVLGFFALLAIGVASFGIMLWVLSLAGTLPPPPLTATSCIDEKFKFLAERDIRNADLIAVGSSVTWRNLDMSAFRRKGLAQKPLNAAPCYLHLSETAYYTEFLLQHMKKVRTVVSVVAPRDFERCARSKEEFFSARLASAYVFGSLPPFPVYFANFRPIDFVKDILHIKRMRTDPNYQFSVVMDQYGSGPVHARSTWLPEPVFDDVCFAALSELERVVNAAGATLVVATFPLQPEWQAKYDLSGELVRSFEERVRAALAAPSTHLLRGSEETFASLQYADALHYVWQSAVEYTAHLAEDMSRH
jgi:hypothetical protein